MPEHSAAGIPGQPETSESEEMYLLTISRALEEGHEGPLGLAALAERLGVSSASANEMIRKMADRDLVAYEPYKGASLTSAGSAIARRVLRTRRLWARFLADHLGFTPAEADEMACDLEHVTSSGAAERLADYLGHPEVGPLGRPIPGPDDDAAMVSSESLDGITAGTDVEIVRVTGRAQVSSFLAASGMESGTLVTVIASGSGGILVSGPGGEVHLDAGTAATVVVQARGRHGG